MAAFPAGKQRINAWAAYEYVGGTKSGVVTFRYHFRRWHPGFWLWLWRHWRDG